MARRKPDIVRDHWRGMTRAAQDDPDQTPEEIRERVERYWPGLTTDPGGLDYLETEVAGLPALWAVPKHSPEDRVILSVHGGGGVSGSIYTHRKMFGHLAKASGVRALITGYHRTAYPVPVEDTVTAYRGLLDQGFDAGHIALAGDSLGAGVSLAAILRARELGLPLPAALMLLSPWVDMTVGEETFDTNRATEEFFYKEVVEILAYLYLGGADPKDPLASPLHADLSGLPPIYIQAGGDETLLGEARRLAGNARAAGVDAEIEVFPGQLHTFQMAAGRSKVSDDAIGKLAQWVRPKLRLP
ncbi:alpha/beta hydrolase fold domain-containing protein [Sphaerisporangium sp. NPDC004334]